MITLSQRRLWTGFLTAILLMSVQQAYAGISDDRLESSMVQLVQSVPEGTNLAQPGMPMTADAWIDMIKKAKSSIDLAQFFLSAEPKSPKPKKGEKHPFEEVMKELEKATDRGVRVRLLLSKAMEKEDPKLLERFKKMRSTEVRTYDLSSLTGGVLHAKYWVVDNREIFMGSQNFDWRSLNQIHEVGVRIENKDIAHQMARIFDWDWKIARTETIPTILPGSIAGDDGNTKVMELSASPQSLNPADIKSSIDSLVALIKSARSSIQVQVLDYSPVTQSQKYWSDLDVALRAAALRDVKVQLMVSSNVTSLRAIDYLKSLSILPGVEIKLVTIPQLPGKTIPFARMIHSKYMVVDGRIFWIGTSNWAKGYFYNSRNVELILRRVDIAQSGLRIFQTLWDSSYAEKIDLNRSYSLPARVVQ